jgi:hypothetical protein
MRFQLLFIPLTLTIGLVVGDASLANEKIKQVPKEQTRFFVHVQEGNHERVLSALNAKHAEINNPKLRGYHTNEKTNLQVHKKFELDWLSALVVEGMKEEDLKKVPGVLSVYPDRLLHAYDNGKYNWGIDRSDQQALPLSSSADGNGDWTNFDYSPTYCGEFVDIYVLDTGLNTEHAVFTNRGGTIANVYDAYNGLANCGGVCPTNNDVNGHGTHCAGSVGGHSIGISTCTNIYGVKILSDQGSGSTSGIVDAMNWVKSQKEANGRQTILSMSLGGGCGGPCPDTDPMNVAVEALTSAGIPVVVAAGNDADDSDNYTPASAVSAITVGAADKDDHPASFTNYGSGIDIFGPGVNILSADNDADTGYVVYSGTSMACPHVAGAMAQIMQWNPLNLAFNSKADVESAIDALHCSSAKETLNVEITAPAGMVPEAYYASCKGTWPQTNTDIMNIPTSSSSWTCATRTTLTDVKKTEQNVKSSVAKLQDVQTITPAFTISEAGSKQNVKVTLCNELYTFADFECTGDTFFTLYDGSTAVGSHTDDYCSYCASLNFQGPTICKEYTFEYGCYGNAVGCSSNGIKLYSTGPISPVQTPVASPIAAPTVTPTVTPTESASSFRLQEYTVSDTNSATAGTKNVLIPQVCGGETIAFSACGGDDGTEESCHSSVEGDTYYRLSGPNGEWLVTNDDTCGLCSYISYTHPIGEACIDATFWQGCYSSGSCAAQTLVIGRSSLDSPNTPSTPPSTKSPVTNPTVRPSASPIANPTVHPSASPIANPTVRPSASPIANPTVRPSASPSASPMVPVEPPIEAPVEGPRIGVTFLPRLINGQQDHVVLLCPNEKITYDACTSESNLIGDTVFDLFSESSGELLAYNDDYCGIGSQVSYTSVSTVCENVRLSQRCYGGGSRCRVTTRQTIEVLPEQTCGVTNENWLGDGYCDSFGQYNTAECGWDGGDCCASTCNPYNSPYYECGYNGYDCLQPGQYRLTEQKNTLKFSTAAEKVENMKHEAENEKIKRLEREERRSMFTQKFLKEKAKKQ